jgi:hypothetical protein
VEAPERLGRGAAVALGALGIALVLYGGYGLVQGTGALVWFAPRLEAGGGLVRMVAAPWAVGGALLLLEGGSALRLAAGRRPPNRRWLGSVAVGAVLSAATGLFWWGWLPFAWFGGGPLSFTEAGPLLHVQFATALLAALAYFTWSRRLQPAREPIGRTLARGATSVGVLAGVLAIGMYERAPDSPVLHNGKSAVEWARQCHSNVEGEDLQAWSALEAMGEAGEPGWRWLVEYETGLGPRRRAGDAGAVPTADHTGTVAGRHRAAA